MVTERAVTPAPTPALATLCHEHFFDDGWLYERKLDGERCLASRIGSRVTLHSRSGRNITHSFPELVDALGAQDTVDFVVDGEVVAFDGDKTSFAALQPRIHIAHPDKARRSGIVVYLYLFDVLMLDGRSARALPLRDRKGLLADVLQYDDPLRLTGHQVGGSQTLLDEACARGWEGLIAKRADAPYPSGRTRDWLKFKCESEQEFVVGGFTEPQGARTGFGALLIGYYRDGELVYAGKVGTGFGHALLGDLHRRLVRIEQVNSPFDAGSPSRRDVHWVQPRLVVPVAFTEWTRAGQLRHPRYTGLPGAKAAADRRRGART